MKVLFYPGDHRKNERHTQSKQMMLTQKLGHEIVDIEDGGDCDVKFHLDFHTIHANPGYFAINANCNDVSKGNVDRQWCTVFGYGAEINPLTYEGLCVVRKNVAQGIHDARILVHPIKPMPGMFYTKLINTRVGKDLFRDIRLVIIGNEVIAVIIKEKLLANRFNQRVNYTTKYITSKIDEWLSKDEQEKVFEFCVNMGLDYGEIDCLRDEDEKLYCVDVNNIPGTRQEFETPEMLQEFEKLLQKFRL